MKTFKITRGPSVDLVEAEAFTIDEKSTILGLFVADKMIGSYLYWDSIVDSEYDKTTTQTKE